MSFDVSTPAKARTALQALEALERVGRLRPAEQELLAQLRAAQPSAEQEVGATAARYRGAAQGATLNFGDELVGLVSPERKADIRANNARAQLDFPAEYRRGQTAGQMLTSAAGIAAPGALGAGVGMQALTGAGLGAAGPALADMGKAEGGALQRAQNIDLFAAGVGAGIGGVAPLAGKGVEAGSEMLRNLMRGTSVADAPAGAVRRVRRPLAQDASIQDIEAYLQSLGDQGMPVDIPGATQATGQALATIPGPGQSALGQAVRERAAGSSQRIDDMMTQRVDEPDAAFAERRAQAEARATQFGPLYDAAKASPDLLDTDGVRQIIGALKQDQTSRVVSALSEIEAELGSGPISALKLHNIRVDLNDLKERAYREGSTDLGNKYKQILQVMDAQLDKIDGYATARAGWANSKDIDEKIDEGRTLFTGGVLTARSPREFGAYFGSLSAPQQEAIRKGAREYIAALMGTSRNDAAAAWQAFQKDWNADKLRIVIGDEAADAVSRMLKGEQTFSQTQGALLSGSQTAFRTEASKALGDLRDPDTSAAPTAVARITQPINTITNTVLNAVLYGGREGLQRGMAKLLTLKGADRDRAVRMMLEEARGLEDPHAVSKLLGVLSTAGVGSLSGAGLLGD